MAKTKGTYGKKLSLIEHKKRIRRANKTNPRYTKFYYKAYRESGGKRSLSEILKGVN